jgi:Ca2+-binding RTX toxin-like protein
MLMRRRTATLVQRRQVTTLAMLACGGLLSVGAVPASATTTVSALPGELAVTGTLATANSITLSEVINGFQFTTTISDPIGATLTGFAPSCTQTNATTVTCDDVFFGFSTINVTGAGGNDSIDASAVAAAAVSVTGGAGNDTLKGGGGNDSFHADAALDGADVMTGGAGGDTFDYAARANALKASADGVAHSGETGENDTVGADVEEIDGGEGNDTLTATSTPTVAGGASPVSSGPSDPTLNGGGGNDALTAGSIDTSLTGGPGDDILNAGAGDDALDGGAGNDTENGGDGDDTIGTDRGFFSAAGTDAGDDQLDGGPGDDRFSQATNVVFALPAATATADGSDNVLGGTGFDTVTYDEFSIDASLDRTPLNVNVSLDDVANDGSTGESDNIHGDVEDVVGGPGDDTLTGDAHANEIMGAAGKDTITGGGGADNLIGGVGDDTIQARDVTADRVDCGVGTDAAVVDDVDALNGCESVSSADVPGPPQADVPPPPPPPVVTVPVASDTTKPKIKITGLPGKVKRKVLLSRGISFSLTTNELTAYDVGLLGAARRAEIRIAGVGKVGDLVLAHRSIATTTRKVTVKLVPAKSLRSAFGRRAKVRVVILATDASRNVSTITRTISVR